jgi:hypothetical protein
LHPLFFKKKQIYNLYIITSLTYCIHIHLYIAGGNNFVYTSIVHGQLGNPPLWPSLHTHSDKLKTYSTKVLALRGKDPIRIKIVINEQILEQVLNFIY